MEGKKRYIAIILFLLICLMVFTFATTGDEELEKDGNGSNIQEVTDKDNSTKEDEDIKSEDEEESKEENKGNNTNSNSTNKDSESNADDEEDLDGTGEVDNSAYDKALEAVEELERLLTDAQADIARDLVEEVTNSDQYKELMERVEDAEDAIDAAELVAQLEQMVKDAAEKADITDAKDFRDDEVIDAIDEIDGENLEAVKEDLLDRIEELSIILDDNTDPTIDGIKDGEYTNLDEVSLTITDENEVDVKVTKDGKEIDFAEKFTEEGTYEVTVVDAAFNDVTKTFTIDRTEPKFEGLTSGNHYDVIKLDVKDSSPVRIMISQDHAKETAINNGTEITEDGTYRIVATDEAGNKKEIWVAIDSTKPTIEPDVEYTNVKGQKVTIADKFLMTVTINGKEYTRSDFAKDKNNENFSMEYTLEEDGEYTIIAKDKKGLSVEKTIILDTVKPAFDNLASREVDTDYYKVEVTDATPVKIYVSKNHKAFEEIQEGYELTEEGTYQLKAVDAAGNEFTTWIHIDKTAPTITVTPDKEYMNVCPTIEVFDRYLSTVTIDGKVYDRKDFTKNSSNENFKLNVTLEDCVDGLHTITAVDKRGLTTTKTFTVDQTPNRVTQTSLSTKVSEGKTYYAINGSTIEFSIGFRELLGEDAKVTIGGKEVVLTYDKFYKDTNTHLYRGTVTIAENESEMTEGELEIVITNITDKAGNKGFYYQTNGKKIIQEYKNVLTTNGRKVIYDRTPNRVTQTSLSTKVAEGKTYYAINGSTIEFSIGFRELLGEDAKVTIGGKEVVLTYDKFYKDTNTHLYRGTLTIAGDESEMTEGELEIVITNITDKAGNKGFYYQTNGKKIIQEYKNVLTTNGRKVIYDRTPNRVTQTSLSTKVSEDKTYYVINGEKIEFSIGFRELLGEDAKVTIGGKEVALTYDKFYKDTNTHLYRGTLTIAEDESEMIEGELEIVITNITDKAGNKGFYYQTNGKKVIQEYKNVLTTNGRKVIYDRTPNRVTQTSLATSVVDGKTYYVKNGGTIEFSIGFRELLGEDAKVTIGGKEVVLTYDKFYKDTNTHLYRGTLTIAEDESEMIEGELEIVITNITDKAGNKGFYYQTNGKKVIQEYKNVLTTNGRKVIYDRTPNRVTQTFFRGENEINKVYYATNGSKIQFNIGFNELLSENAVVTIGGKEVALTYDKFYKDTNSHMYYGYLEINTDDQLPEGTLEIKISNITDFVGNKGFYYQTNGKKVYEELSRTETTNGKQIFYDVTGPEVTPSYTKTTTEQDEEFTNYPDFEIKDNSNQSVSEELISGTVDTTTLGSYKLTYRFTDVVGNYTDVTVTVNVVDTKAPTISGIEDGAYYNTKDTHAIPTAYDKNGAVMFIRTELGDLKLTSFLKNEKEIKLVGTYTVYAVDIFGNKSKEYTIHIDPYNPKVLVLDRIENVSGAYLPIKPVILEHNLETIEVTLNGQKIDYKEGDKLTKDGKYVMTVTDKAKNSTTVEFTMDSIAPTMMVSPLTLGVVDELDLNKANSIAGDLIISEDAEYKLMKVEKYITVLDKSIPIYAYAELPEDKIINEEGEYILIAYDKAYNVTAAKFIVDRTAPVINGVEDGKSYNGPVTITIEEANPAPLIGTVLSKKTLGIYIPTTFPEDGVIDVDGEYSIKATDIAGNESATIKFSVDTTAPEINVDIKEEILQTTEPVNVVAKVTDNISASKELSPNVTKIVSGEETDLGIQNTIDASVNGVTYRLEYSTTDDAGNVATKVIETTVVNITYEVRFNKTSYSSTYNGTSQEVPKDATFYMIKDGVESVVEDAVITYSSSAPLLNAGKYTITATYNGYTSEPVEFTMDKATIKVDLTNLPSKLAIGSTKAGLIANTSIIGNYEGEEIVDYKLYQIGIPTNEIETVEKASYCAGVTIKDKCYGLTTKYSYDYVVYIKEEYETNYKIENAVNIDLTSIGVDFRISGLLKVLSAE